MINLTPPYPTDILAHRELAASISYTPLHPSLHCKSHVERIMEMEGRVSVEFYAGLALKGRAETIAKEKRKGGEGVAEAAFVIRMFSNGVGVFVFGWVGVHICLLCTIVGRFVSFPLSAPLPTSVYGADRTMAH
ncbi:hypothetical protein HYDPIDRAFT_34741 [Hydnomerulius pinastri MD-312]|uniref:Uncharacterized protein n=1 Tax=Hydnomerulius pinastri MD-312 TaxID=994086 RepID=A0A0C9UXT6_9AGAM|nr:hypothetical protein HYDPIDRAFT_34741 [Hydnomerulius pinastri MD-312]